MMKKLLLSLLCAAGVGSLAAADVAAEAKAALEKVTRLQALQKNSNILMVQFNGHGITVC